MKVRHKQSGMIFPDGFLNTVDHLWYCITDQGEKTKWLEGVCEPLYKPVPTEQWKDVTVECSTENFCWPLPRERYRLRKVQFDVPCKPDGGWAFIVERKVSE